VDRGRHQGRDDYCLVFLEAEEGDCEVVKGRLYQNQSITINFQL
jgi:hypothetical protein